ncbi:MAG: hypothetical protein WBJ10_05950 [Daejeonella sp.]|uniref:hypothetical protein n=1 Tax=Daejeonella sp. TaxID=2805397 RepID=UPI003C761E6B
MEAIRTIYTIDARDNIYLESMAEAMKLDHETVYDVIGNMFDELLNELKKVKINYPDLKNCLTPQKQKREIAFLRKEMLSALRRMAFFISGVKSAALISME